MKMEKRKRDRKDRTEVTEQETDIQVDTQHQALRQTHTAREMKWK